MGNILITGSAGFIGMHLCKKLLEKGNKIIGIDNMNDYYDPTLKEMRLNKLKDFNNFSFIKEDITNQEALTKIFKKFTPKKVVNLAAQAGVRYSIENPDAYISSNVAGFMNVIELCREFKVDRLIYASSSSVYGNNHKIPFSENDRLDNPISIYAVTKISNELMAKTYSSLFGLNTTGLRFFSVYGPWGRPDMAISIFTKKIINDETITVYNNGEMERDFTYIDDVVNGMTSSLHQSKKFEIFNLGNNRTYNLLSMVNIIEKYLGKKAQIKFEDIQLGDVKATYANIDKAKMELSYIPKISLEEGISKFIDWYKKIYRI